MQFRGLWPVWSLCFRLVGAVLTNVTIDDRSPRITYRGIWYAQNAHQSPLDYGGSHSLSEDTVASATFTFTGVAIYYFSALWPYRVDSTITLDGEDSTLLNLMDPFATPTDGGSASSPYGVRWAKTGLTNSLHEVIITIATQYIVVDGFNYTMDDGRDDPTEDITETTSGTLQVTSTVFRMPSQTLIGLLSETPSETPSDTASDSKKSNIVPIVVGASVGGVTFFIVIGLVAFFWRRRRHEVDHDFVLDDVASNPFAFARPPSMATNTVIYSAIPSQYGSLTASVNPSTHPHTGLRATSFTYGDEDFNPYSGMGDFNVRHSLVSTSHVTTSTNFAGMGSGMAADAVATASSSSRNTLSTNRFVDEKRAQSLSLAEKSVNPPAYTPS